MKLVFPTELHELAVNDFYDEIQNDKTHIIGFNGFDNYRSWLSHMRNRLSGINLPEYMVRESYYLCFEKEKLIGVFSLKHTLNDYLFQFGGHVGYAVRPSERGKGYATKILSLGLMEAEKLGIAKVLAVCSKQNLSSARVIVKNGGVLENEIWDPEEKEMIQRYWIAVK